METNPDAADSLRSLHDKIDAIATELAKFTELLDRFLPTLEKYEQGGVRALVFNKKKGDAPQWPIPNNQ